MASKSSSKSSSSNRSKPKPMMARAGYKGGRSRYSNGGQANR